MYAFCPNEAFDCVIVLGSQVGINDKGEMVPAFHTEMKVRAAGIAWQQQIANKFILIGGYNFDVRYELYLDVPVFGTKNSNRKPDFSDEAKKRARYYRSEASVMAEMIKREYDVWPQALILEEESSTTQQNAELCAEILEDLFFSRAGGKKATIGIIALLYHMERALAEFKKAFEEKEVSDLLSIHPLFAENLLATRNDTWISRICQYYSIPQAGKQWDTGKIKQLLIAGQSLSAMIQS